jgi:eukaryotic-like serine/threonine-protein kinase
MDASRWQKVTDLFELALAIDDSKQRLDWLDRKCGADSDLRVEVESLLQAHFDSTDFLEQPPTAETTRLIGARLESMWIGRSIGNWRILKLIHQGGMGSVFLASRDSGDFEQTAALKIIRTELASESTLERFARERQLLAHLEHPNISRLLDGGTTEDHVPWLVMEYVDGEPVTTWCDTQQLTISERLELFARICEAVAYAHRKLIIHRDIKPDNILVSSDGTPKLLDFGIAKLETPDSSKTARTLTSQRVLTPGYASPEQFSGQAIGTASDVYSLGMLLYELLTGTPAYRVEPTQPIVEVEDIICRRNPESPSHRLRKTMESDPSGKLAASRRMTRDQLRRELRGDLDDIVMKALRKEPERRYASVDALREDLHRYQQGLPVRARPDTLTYRASRFIRRHWFGVSATAAVILALAIGLAVTLLQTEQLRAERDRTLQINSFLQDILLEADPYQAGADATVRDLLNTAGSMIEQRFADQPDLEATLRLTVGKTQLNLMELASAEANLVRTVQLHHDLYGPGDDRTLEAGIWLAWLAYRNGDFSTAERRYRDLLDRIGPESSWHLRAETLNELAIVLVDTGKVSEAQQAYREALDLWLDNDPDNFAVALLHNNIAGTWRLLDSTEKAVAGYRQALILLRQHFPDNDNPYLATNMTNLAILLQGRDGSEEALDLHRESLAIRLATLGENHAATGMGHLQLGRHLIETGAIEAAREHIDRALDISTNQLKPHQLQVLLARSAQAHLQLHDDAADHATAIAELTEVQTLMRDNDAPERHIEEIDDWIRAFEQNKDGLP